MSLAKEFDIKKNDIISFIGSGGKTTTIYKLARELIFSGSVLITTTTKMKVPENLLENEIFIESYDELKDINVNNKIVIAGRKTVENKFNALTDEDFIHCLKIFDYILIEADGSKRLPYKAWREFEPVIRPETTKTIGVIPMKYFGEILRAELIFNEEKFKENFGFKEELDFETIKNIIFHEEGIFKNAVGEKVIYFNQYSFEKNEITQDYVKKLIDYDDKINYIIEKI